jgi:hypothetical protein
MSTDRILAEIDAEIKRMQQARNLLAAIVQTAATATKPATKKRKKRKMSAESRKRIADAQRKRWAKQKSKK